MCLPLIGTLADSRSVESLVTQAKKLLDNCPLEEKTGLIWRLLPSKAQWRSALRPFQSFLPCREIAAIDDFGSAEAFVNRGNGEKLSGKLPADALGQSLLWRQMEFTTQIVRDPDVVVHLTKDQVLELWENMVLGLQFGADNLRVADATPLWTYSSPEVESRFVESTADCKRLLTSWLQGLQNGPTPSEILARLRDNMQGNSLLNYYYARAYHAVASDLVDRAGYSATATQDSSRRISKSYESLFSDLAQVYSCEGKAALRALNETLADLTGQDISAKPLDSLRSLLILNCLLQRPDELAGSVAQQRVVFYVQHVVGALDLDAPPTLTMEILRSLHTIIPVVQEIYGTFWDTILEFVYNVLAESKDVALRLLSIVTKSSVLEANDDLLDAWKERQAQIAQAMVDLAVSLRDLPEEHHSPRLAVNGLLRRLLPKMSALVTSKEEDLYGLVASQ